MVLNFTFYDLQLVVRACRISAEFYKNRDLPNTAEPYVTMADAIRSHLRITLDSFELHQEALKFMELMKLDEALHGYALMANACWVAFNCTADSVEAKKFLFLESKIKEIYWNYLKSLSELTPAAALSQCFINRSNEHEQSKGDRGRE